AVGTVPEDAVNPAGFTVATFAGNPLRTIESVPVTGIAITEVSGTGVWQYSRDSGRTWLALGSPTSEEARLLRDSDLIRFLPAQDWNGTAVAYYHVWDRTSGAALGVNRYARSIEVLPSNDAPVMP